LTARQSLKKSFRKKKTRLYHSLAQKHNVFSLCLKHLSEAREQLMKNPPDGITQDALLAGQVNTYQSGRRRLKRAMKDPSMENNHNLRKAAKNLWNQTQVLRILWPSVFDPVIRSLDRLCDEMGMDHDLAELQAVIKGTSLLNGKDLDHVLKAAEGQRKKSQRLAWQLAGKIYAETPAAFSKRMKVYWELMLKK
jgi:CHAD domain-containing protein